MKGLTRTIARTCLLSAFGLVGTMGIFLEAVQAQTQMEATEPTEVDVANQAYLLQGIEPTNQAEFTGQIEIPRPGEIQEGASQPEMGFYSNTSSGKEINWEDTGEPLPSSGGIEITEF
jgi:hypothetical protein